MIRAVSKLEAPGTGSAPTAKLSVVSPATVTAKPVYPTTRLNIAIAAVAGLFVGAMWVLLREALNRKVRDARDAEAALDTRTLAVLAGDRLSKRGRLIDFGDKAPPATASFGDLCSRLVLELRDQSKPKLLVTSAHSTEDKTTVVINVAAALARAANQVAIVDANTADPQVVRSVGASARPGLTDVISGQIQLFEAVQRRVGGLDTLAVLGAGTTAAGLPEDLFLSTAFPKVLEELARQFDYVIVDGPALLDAAGTEAILLSVDGVVVVVRQTVSTITDLVECRTRLSNAGARLLGIVQIDSRKKRSRHRNIEASANKSAKARTARFDQDNVLDRLGDDDSKH
jgi:Mrp family chromosome partitioning ATPase